MSEGNNELVSIADLPDDLNPYKDFRQVAEKKFDDLLIQITTDGVNISEEQANRLMGNAHRALTIGNKINNGPITGYENGMTLRFSKEDMPGLLIDSNAHRELLNEDDNSQAAAIIHELIHAIEEDIPHYYETVPVESVALATEFMFTGNSRKPLFLHLTEEVSSSMKNESWIDSHAIGWKKSLQMLSKVNKADVDPKNESAEIVIGKIENIQELDDSKKIAIVQDFIKQGKSS